MRLNARIPDEQYRALEDVAARTGRTVSEVVRTAIGDFLSRRGEQAPTAFEALVAAGFVGCGEGPEDLSERYKEYLHEGLAEKHGLR
jgi:hypothetical protein